jgi:hypothetical protein
MEMHIKSWMDNNQRRDNLAVKGTDGTILKQMSDTKGVEKMIGFNWLIINFSRMIR